MKRRWDPYDLTEHWTLLPSELELLGNKAGATPRHARGWGAYAGRIDDGQKHA